MSISQPIPVTRTTASTRGERPNHAAHTSRRSLTIAISMLATALVTLGLITFARAWSSPETSVTTGRGVPGTAIGASNAATGAANATGDDAATGTGLTPQLNRAWQKAEAAASAAGVTLVITSGHRSAQTQQQLYEQAIAKYGTPELARRWVLPPNESAHVRGAAIDVGPREGARWLETNGVRYGLCRRYANEWWHFEVLAPAKGQACPSMEPYAGG